MKRATILIVDDEKNILTSLSRPLTRDGYVVKSVQTGKEALEIIKEDGIDLVMLDVWLPDIDGLEVLRQAREIDHDLVTIVMSGHGTIDTAVKATKLGAFDFMEKPLSLDKVLLQIDHALKYRAMEEANKGFRQAIEEEYQIVGKSVTVHEMLEKISRVAATHGRVLITGENGTGKELVARAIHTNSTRKDGPFIKVNCAAIPNELIESELFGHERGSFTGATDRRKGKFELADGGTIFLDEIGDMSFPTQAKILRVLTDDEIDRVGGAKPIKVDVRVIAATNKNLEDEIRKKNFREDLYYRLNVVPFYVLPLRERKEDIPLLAEHFLKRYCMETQTKARRFDETAFELLSRYEWPGNIRELKNIVERVAILSPSDIIGQADISTVLPMTSGMKAFKEISSQSQGVPPGMPFKDVMDYFEKKVILEALRKHEWNVSKAAESLEMERSHLYKKMRSLNITREEESSTS